jgi:hypothetical protein
MHKHFLSIIALLFFAGLFSCSKNKGVVLTVDFSSSPQWNYTMDSRVWGTISTADTQKNFESHAVCTLSGSPDIKNRALLHATIHGITITSTILGEAEIQNLCMQAKNTKFTCNLAEGLVLPDDSSSLPGVHIGEWDLFKALAKTIPSLPKIRIQPKSSWDRERIIPLSTKYGPVQADLVQSFSLDTLYESLDKKLHARVIWHFSYQIDSHQSRNNGVLAKIPSKGTGSGMAILNLHDKTMEFASIDFRVPLATEGPYRIAWNESIALTLQKH